jgi:predicted phosphodiesterase
MLLGFCSDPHSNFAALEAVVADMRSKSVQTKYCLGDIVGYYAEPNETIDLIRKEGFVCVQGNHDHYLTMVSESTPEKKNSVLCILRTLVNNQASSAIGWTAEHVTKKNVKFLSQLPARIDLQGTGTYQLRLTHASPHSPAKCWAYIGLNEGSTLTTNVRDAWRMIPQYTLHFYGHEHKPFVFAQHEEIAYERLDKPHNFKTQKIAIPKGTKQAIVNVGSAGQPRDECQDVCWVSYDTEKALVTFHRVAYDVTRTIEALNRAGYDRDTRLTKRLLEGV